MSNEDERRLVIDEINTDREGREIATLVDEEGRQATVPRQLLPAGATVNDVIIATFQLDIDSTRERMRRVRGLQHRLFNRDGEGMGL